MDPRGSSVGKWDLPTMGIYGLLFLQKEICYGKQHP